jgi:hypothetical protein
MERQNISHIWFSGHHSAGRLTGLRQLIEYACEQAGNQLQRRISSHSTP